MLQQIDPMLEALIGAHPDMTPEPTLRFICDLYLQELRDKRETEAAIAVLRPIKVAPSVDTSAPEFVRAKGYLRRLAPYCEKIEDCPFDEINDSVIVAHARELFPKVELSKVLDDIAQGYGFSVDSLQQKYRTKREQAARRELCFLLRAQAKLKFAAIGDVLNRHWTGAITAANLYAEYLKSVHQINPTTESLRNADQEDKIAA